LPAISAPTSEVDLRGVSDVRSRKVLLVDDNDDVRESLAAFLDVQGHEVRMAHDAASALNSLRSEKLDVAFIDIGLPVVNGYELVSQFLAEVSDGERPLLVALTGYGLPQDHARSAASGFDVHFVKPVNLDELLALLRRDR